ncbi:DUF3313 domain-containing protein [Enterobacillus tribolii]|uniref:Uncharacterized protein DUF3313 n=1 Tax=Enterobacillus tribolii TaxID=1487935 RepID=A0A370R2Z3_9GAMM|nr:DUF3313 domain-containing protein [Enterobacillus tribolii]MBW7983863.1 DUF3313 domain-containing protein [Enterobacillus tribolii]RDK96799.1 uncharacterized protein DUF3313 [Enterobacillus tribolii]
MITSRVLKSVLLVGAVVLGGCTSHVTKPDQYSGFLGDYSGLSQATSPSGKPVLRWVDPSFKPSAYTKLVWNPITYYPRPNPDTQVTQQVLDSVLDYTNSHLKTAAGQRLQLVSRPEAGTLIFRGAITQVNTEAEGLQFYEVLPVTLVVAGAESASGHRTMNTNLYFEGELIDAATGKPVLKVVRKGAGKDISNSTQKVTFNDLKPVVDNLATDITEYH